MYVFYLKQKNVLGMAFFLLQTMQMSKGRHRRYLGLI